MAIVYEIIVIIILNLACYYSTLPGEFVFDDSVAILKNKDVSNKLSKQSFKDIFINHDFWGNNLTSNSSHKSYRPITTFTFALQNHLDGELNSQSMKTVNLVIHVLNSCLLIQFYKAIFPQDKSRLTRNLVALLFSVHPIHTEAVCGIVGRTDLLACLVFLITNLKHFTLKHVIYLKIIGLLAVIGVMCKENGITILPTIAAIDILRNTKFQKLFNIPKHILMRLIILTVMTLTILIVRLKIQNFEGPTFRVEDNPIAATNRILTRILSQNYLYVLNLYLLLCPEWLSFDWSFDSIHLINDFTDIRILFIVIFYMILMTIVYLGLKNNSTPVLISLSILTIPFMPASGFIKLGFVIAERILYIPSIGLSLLVGIGLKNLLNKFQKRKNIIFLMLSFLLLIHGLRSRSRGIEWSSERKLFFSALQVTPNNAKVYYNIARISTDTKELEISLKYYKKAIQLYPKYESAHMNLGNLYRENKDYKMAKFHLQRAVQIMDDFPTAWMNLGIVQATLKEYQNAETSYFKALSFRPRYSNCFYNLGNLYIEMKNDSLALINWRKAVSINPMNQKAWSNILAYYDNNNQLTNHDEVIKYSDLALTYLPNDTNILFSRANTMGKIGKFEESEKIFLEIIKIEPKALFYANLGVLYHRWNKKELAENNYIKALSLDSNLKNARNNLSKLKGANNFN
ncbi:unnamed protein product [Diamesa serratosioi]